MTWSPPQYLKFEDERTPPTRELLARVPLDRAVRVVNLGCGPGNSTNLLVERFGSAAVSGLDNDPAILVTARTLFPRNGAVPTTTERVVGISVSRSSSALA